MRRQQFLPFRWHNSKDHLRDFGTARTDQAKKAEDFAGSKFKSNIFDEASSGSPRTPPRGEPIFDLFFGKKDAWIGPDQWPNCLFRLSFRSVQ